MTSLPKSYLCFRAASPLHIDGRLDKAAWKDAPWTDDFADIEGDVRPRPPLRTRAKMLWDDRYLYIGATLEEPHVWATLTEHDSVIFHDNDFEVFIDPDGDNHDYYEIEINALNTVWDLRLVKPYRDGGPALDSWEIPGLKTAVHVDGTLNDPTDRDTDWSVEFAIPWTVLGEFARRPAPPRDGDQWRINFSRVEWDIDTSDGTYRKIPNRPEHNWVWSPQGVIDMHRPERWGYIEFAHALPGKQANRKVAPDPSADARERLMAVYWAQRAYQRQAGAWAGTLAELFPQPGGVIPPEYRDVTLTRTAEGWTATVRFKDASGATRTATVREDSRLRVD